MEASRIAELSAPPVLTHARARGFHIEEEVQCRTLILRRPYVDRRKTSINEWTDMDEQDPRFQEASYTQTWYSCRRALMRIVQGYNQGSARLFGYFANFHVRDFVPDRVSIMIDPELVGLYDGKPIADISVGYSNEGGYKNTWGASLKLHFASDAQANGYIIASGLGMPKMLQHKGSTYELQNNGAYVSNDGLILAAAVVLFYLTPSAEGRAELVATHPELAGIAAPDSTGFTQTDGVSGAHTGTDTMTIGSDASGGL